MASIAFSSFVSQSDCTGMASAWSSHKAKEGSFTRKNVIVCRRHDQVVRRVATRPPAITIPLPEKERATTKSPERSHVAWTSIRHPRWEGELTVEGEIPLWLIMSSKLSQGSPRNIPRSSRCVSNNI
ncbi:hypothetical protein CRG98_012422 [Punica granatum]|uniref:Uncharacterized protein n=1 Tax=Punica granatum TaxID=22663 RepID=A0A2I0KG59_PUNGR|nr:hypothetical protein CRG98_012422 [Punica granatum]